MASPFFWNKWEKSSRILYLSGLFLLILAASLLMYFHFMGFENTLEYSVSQKMESVEVPLESFDALLHQHDLTINNYLIVQFFGALPETLSLSHSHVFIFFLTIALCFGLTAITYIKTMLWSVIGILGFAVFFALLKLELTETFGWTDQKLVWLAGGANILAAIVFINYGEKIASIARFLAFALINGILLLVMAKFSSIHFPELIPSNAGLIPVTVVALLFILMISYDTINGFFFLTTRSKSVNGKGNLFNLIAISLLYLIAIFLMFLERVGAVKLELMFINPMVILILSTFIGIWSHRKRAIRYGSILPYHPSGGFLYIAFGIITMATLFYAFATRNDSMIILLEEFILYSHLFFGLCFLIYLLINFGLQISKNQPAYKAVYDPPLVPLYFVRVVGVLIVIAMYQRSDWQAIHTWRSAYYNMLADMCKHEMNSDLDAKRVKRAKDNEKLMHHFYNEGFVYNNNSFKSTYNLAILKELDYIRYTDKQDYNDADKYYINCLESRYVTPHAFINAASFYKSNNYPKKALRVLNQGHKKFPKNHYILNNLALYYQEVETFSTIDSTGYFLDKAQELTDDDLLRANQLATSIKNLDFQRSESFEYSLKKKPASVEVLTNSIASRNLRGKRGNYPLNESFWKDSTLSKSQFACLYNSFVHHYNDADTAALDLHKYVGKEQNFAYVDPLIYLEIALEMNRGDRLKALHNFHLLLERNQSDKNAYADQSLNLGKYLLREKNYASADRWFQKSNETQLFEKFNDAPFYESLTKTITGQRNLAIGKWSVVNKYEKLSKYPNAGSMINILSRVESDSVTLNDDRERAWFIYFNKTDTGRLYTNTFTHIQDPIWKGVAAAALSEAYLAHGNVEKAYKFMTMAPDQGLDEKTENHLNFVFLKILDKANDAGSLKKELKNGITLNPWYEKYVPYFEARILEIEGKKKEAFEAYKKCDRQVSTDLRVLRHITLFYLNNEQGEEAYDLILAASLAFPEDIDVLRLYADVSIENLYFGFAESVLQDMYFLMDDEDYKAYETELNDKLDRKKAELIN